MNKTIAIAAIVMFAVVLGMSAMAPVFADNSAAAGSNANCNPAQNDKSHNNGPNGNSQAGSAPSRADC